MISLESLKKIPLLESLSEEELSQLSLLLKERRVPKGSYIVYAQDPGPSMMFLALGKVKINLTSDDGKEVVLATLDEGEFFGEIALLAGTDRSANVVALTDCIILILSEQDFHRHLSAHTGLALSMLRELALRLRAASSKIGDLALYDVYRRIARTLKSLAVKEMRDGQEALIIKQRPTHQELAAMVGTSREMVTRALKGLEEDKCILMQGRELQVLKLPR